MGAEPIKLGIVGALGRGASFKGACDALQVDVRAVCDINPEGLGEAAKRLGAAEQYTNYGQMLDQGGLDAVIIATPMPLHVPQSKAALERGIHVLSEVPAGVTIEECQQLVLACRNSKAVYMMAENYIYSAQNMLVTELVKRGLFGTPYFAEGEYIHELKTLNQRTPWRRQWQTGINGVTYPTHSLGPILQWMPGDRVTSVCCAGSAHHYKDPRGHDYENEDSILMLCKMAKGGLVKIRVDMLSDRPHAMTNYQLQGTDGCYESARAEGEPDRIWLRAHSQDPNQWQRLQDLREQYLPAMWRNASELAAKAGHGGGDYFEMVDFIDAVQGKNPPTVGIDQAMDMTLPGLASQQSIANAGRWVSVADSRTWTTADTLPRGSLHMVWPGHLRNKQLEVRIPDGYRLRQYEPADEPQYAALMEKAGFGTWDHARVHKTFEGTLSNAMFVIEHIASRTLVATTMALHNPQELHPHGGELGWVAADPAHRGKGLGVATCSAVMNTFLSRGYERVYLMTDDFRLPAITIYLKLGFEPSLHTLEMVTRWDVIRKQLAAYKPGDKPGV